MRVVTFIFISLFFVLISEIIFLSFKKVNNNKFFINTISNQETFYNRFLYLSSYIDKYPLYWDRLDKKDFIYKVRD